MNKKKIKLVSAYSKKSVTPNGDLAKVYWYTYDNGTVLIRKHILSDKKTKGYKCVCSKFGKHLLVEAMALKEDTFYNIAYTHTTELRTYRKELKDTNEKD